MTTCPQLPPFNSPGTSCAQRLPAPRYEGLSTSRLILQAVTILPTYNARSEMITVQREATARATLDRDIQALPGEHDPRRESWTCCDSFSSAWVSSWPSAWRGWALSPREFREVFRVDTYLGLPSPCVRALAGQAIQRSGLTQLGNASVTSTTNSSV